MPLASINPATGEKLKEFSPLNDAEIEKRLSQAEKAFKRYRRTTLPERAELLHDVSELLFQERQTFAETITLEMGKLFRDSVAEIEKCARGCRFYAENGARFLEEEPAQTDAAESYVEYQPLGVVLAVMPWNFPFWQVFRFAAPALVAGNVGLLKHASNVPQCALAITDIFSRAGFPDGAFQTLLIGSEAVQDVLEDSRVAAATLTGSEPAGRSVASIAGKQIKKTVLELGGSDPFIVMPSADLKEAVGTAVKARTINNGQSCIAAKRFIVHGQIYDEFEKGFVEAMKALRVGDPMNESTDVGPLATKQILKDLEEQVQVSVAAGAKILTGGQRLKFEDQLAGGNFYEPTVLADIPKDSPAFSDEIFGPVASLFHVKDIDEAIDLANATTFGLGAAAWTNDSTEPDRFVEEIESGCVFLNSMVAPDTRLPLGAVNYSGYGRELGEFGIREFVNIKTVWIK